MRRVILLWAALAALPLPALALERAPALAAQAWLLVDYDSGSVLVEHNADRPLPPASLTKLMSAYLVLEKLRAGTLKLGDPVAISRQAAMMRGSRIYLRTSSVATIEDLIKSMVVSSANDATVALAEHVAGSEEQFVAEMNARARIWNLQGTSFANSTGLDAPGHYSTARDLTRIAAALIRDFPDYYRWFSLRDFTFNKIKHYNSNALLWRDDTVDGMKTGYTLLAGYCLISSASREQTRLISAVLGAHNDRGRVDSNKRLLDYGFRNFETRLLYAANKPATEVRVWLGETPSLPLGLRENLYVTLPRGWHTRVRTRLTIKDMLYAPVRYGQRLGVLAVQLDDQVFAEYPLVALKDITAGGLMQQTIDNVQLWWR